MLAVLRSLFTSRNKPAGSTKSRKHSSDQDIVQAFRDKYSHFRNLLESNSELLQIIAELQIALIGDRIFGAAFLRSQAARALFHATRIVKSLNAISGGRFHPLDERLQTLRTRINAIAARGFVTKNAPFIMRHAELGKESVDIAGGKNANLGEMAGRLGLPIPKGFAITTSAFAAMLEAEGRLESIRSIAIDITPEDTKALARCSEEIQALILSARIPKSVTTALEDAWHQAFSASQPREGAPPPTTALRSSAVGEDSELSFAGQYLSILGVPYSRLMESYRLIVASLFTARAISYRLFKGIPLEDAAMGVACLEMVDSVASGVMYSRHPFDAADENVLINAVWGLGPYAVDGVVPPDAYRISRGGEQRLLSKTVSTKRVQLRLEKGGGVKEHPVPESLQKSPCLSEAQAIQLARWSLLLEKHYGTPQDTEWAMDQEGQLLLLQTRPLGTELLAAQSAPAPAIKDQKILLQGGDTACPGAGCGPVHLVESDDDLDTFPKGAVLVAKHSSPRYVVVLQHAAAIITDSGSVTGHMASLAREFRVPALFNAREAMQTLQQGQIVTVDAWGRRIYAGEVSELLTQQSAQAGVMKGTPIFTQLQELASLIVPLTLTNPKSSSFTVENCKTLHDVMRLAHEHSYTEMFSINDVTSRHSGITQKLEAPIPFDLYVIDLGDGLTSEATKGRVRLENVLSAPFKALLAGMLDENLRAKEPRPVHLGGFLSVMAQQMLAPPNQGGERFGDRSYALVSDRYLNFSSRVGYHYGIVDAYCGKTVNKNYVNFEFKGGAADDVRRNRRVRAIGLILEELGFNVEAIGDRVTARFQKYEAGESLQRLEALGRLLLFTRQMDMLMNSENSVERAARCFREGCYDFSS